MKFKYTLLTLLFVALNATNYAQSAHYRTETFNAFIGGKINTFDTIIHSMVDHLSADKSEQIDLLEYYYGLIGHYIDVKQNDLAQKALEKANLMLKDAEKKYPNTAEFIALKSNFIGFQIALTPIKAPLLFRSMLSNAKDAVKKGSNSPLVNIMYANLLFYMPDMFGGNDSEALKYYQQACRLMEQKSEYTTDNWLYIQLLVSIGLVNEQLGKYAEAESVYHKVMTLQPQYAHVKNVLYPRLQTKKGA